MNRLGPVWAGMVVCVALLGWGQDPERRGEAGWPEYGGSLAGQRYSAVLEIDRENVSRLQRVWTLDVRHFEGAKPRGSAEHSIRV